MTRHWVEAYVDNLDGVSFRLVCEEPGNCVDTLEEFRSAGCSVTEWFGEVGGELVVFPPDKQVTFGTLEVAAKWRGFGEDAELELRPPAVAS